MIDFTYELTIPANTLATAPTELDVTVGEGMLKRIIITWKRGCRYYVNTALFYGGSQFAPIVNGQGYAFDNYNLTIYPDYDLTQKHHVLTIKGWSPDTTYAHTLRYVFSIDKPANTGIAEALQALFR